LRFFVLLRLRGGPTAGQEPRDPHAQAQKDGGRSVLHGSFSVTPRASRSRVICSAIGRGGLGVFCPSRPATFSHATTGPGPASASAAPAFQPFIVSNVYTRPMPAAPARSAKSVWP